MGKLMVGGTRFLFLCAVVLMCSTLALPNTSSAQVYNVTINPTQGPPGTSVMGTGTNWPYPGDSIQVTWDDASQTILANAPVLGDGSFSVFFTVPSNASAGAHTIRFTAIGPQHTPFGLPVDFTVTPGQSQPTPGWYKNSGPSIIHETSTGLRTVWENSYIYQHPGTDNLYWYAEVKYLNMGSQPILISCVDLTNLSLAKEHIRGTEGIPPNGDGFVTAEETFCHLYPTFTTVIEPGDVHFEWAIFHNVPPGGEVSLEWLPYGSSAWVNPWYSRFSAAPPPVCPPELVSLGTCEACPSGSPAPGYWYVMGSQCYTTTGAFASMSQHRPNMDSRENPPAHSLVEMAVRKTINNSVNGNFEAGNTGFSTAYTYSPGNLSPVGTYTVDTNPQANTPSFSHCGDHTTGKGNMMIVNGAVQSNDVTVWSETLTVLPNQNYTFSGWATSVSPGSPAYLGVSVNDVPMKLFQLSNTPCEWQQFAFSWFSGLSTKATIRIVNTNTNATGNDFALDDLFFGSNDAIEVGWMVSPCSIATSVFCAANKWQDSDPHLFVSRTVGAQTGCTQSTGHCYAWEANSGWVPVQNAKHHVGDAVDVTSTPQQFIVFYSESEGNWGVSYRGELIGYFPANLWPDKRFTQLTRVDWYGEVYSTVSGGACTEMGNRIKGSQSGSAVITDMGFINADGSEIQANVGLYETNPNFYDMGNLTGHSFRYGGSGTCSQ